ncbi:GNAT family N-acetyltransferase [Geodermatophilus sp. DSM 44513]|uniref:GNAT family N-acetyltransferase n=1 Tax=Geodermatophilus sp. DSM 44513 TaxID=1528104 RepID=UPI0012836442|nr:GNAT family N-acetyltransferase [Geodermatophilus sp. DSM 44513]WNV77126.1 GNAT family N-acetyltransferase [Geodermatophilus sp. DSM 44513]
MPPELTVRPLTEDDRELLRTATLANLDWAGTQRFTSRDVEETPAFRHYTDLRPERGDLGFVAERAGRTVGVVWLLFLGSDDPGYGFVADGVPELGLSVWPGHRGQGIGGHLLRRALAESRRRGLPRVSLSVEPANPAVHLYRAVGFTPVPGAADGTLAVDL